MVLPKLNREIFMDKSLIAWTHGQLNESKRKLTYRKKIFSEVGKSLFLDRFQSKSLFRTRIKIRVPFCKSQPSINSIGNPITLVLEPENFSIIKSARVCNP